MSNQYIYIRDLTDFDTNVRQIIAVRNLQKNNINKQTIPMHSRKHTTTRQHTATRMRTIHLISCFLLLLLPIHLQAAGGDTIKVSLRAKMHSKTGYNSAGQSIRPLPGILPTKTALPLSVTPLCATVPYWKHPKKSPLPMF